MTINLALSGARAHVLTPPGALVQGRDGALPAQHLFTGDRLVARYVGYLTLVATSRLRLEADLVEVTGGFLPGMSPPGPLTLPASQMIRVRGALVAAQELIAMGQARPLGRRMAAFVALGFAQENVVFAGGLALAGTRDCVLLAA